MPKCILTEQGGRGGSGGGGSGFEFLSLDVQGSLTKTRYLDGDEIDLTGLTITAHYGSEGVELFTNELTSADCIANPLTAGQTDLVVSVKKYNTTRTFNLTGLTVNRKLLSISATKTTTTYEYSNTLSTGDVVVTGTFSIDGTGLGTNDVTTAVVSGSTFNPANSSALNIPVTGSSLSSNTDLSISYTENGITKTTTVPLTIVRKTVTKPTWKGTVVRYNDGNTIDVSGTTYWNNFNTEYMTIAGASSAAVGQKNATFTCKDNYRFDAQNSLSCLVAFTISKALNQITNVVAASSPANDFSYSNKSGTLTINGSNYTGVALTITRKGTGTVTASSNAASCMTLVSGVVVTLKGDNSTSGTATVTISVAADGNYEADSVTITVTASYWTSFTAATWEDVHNVCAGGHVADHIHVGDTKTMNHGSILGATSEQIKVIGINYDAANSITIQTTNGLPNMTTFSSSAATWSDSQARTLCREWASTCDAKNYIKTVRKYTSTKQSGAVIDVTAADETGFLPSMAEVNLKSYAYYNGGTGYHEYPVYNSGTNGASGTAYPAYTNNNSRIKKKGDSGSAYDWWTRSRGSGGSNTVCLVYTDGSGNNYDHRGSDCLAPAAVVG